MAGADRVEGTLFGNGERTGNVCLSTLALNLFSRGIDPQLDFSDIDRVRQTVEFCNQMPVPARHPYVGDLVYTAFSGTHQDAIAKGMSHLEQRAKLQKRSVREVAWNVPYLPIDPKDVGRSYESVVRVNSQSGKGGIAHVLKSNFGLNLPTGLRVEFGRTVQRVTDSTGVELTPDKLWELFRAEYLQQGNPLLLKEFAQHAENGGVRIDVSLVMPDGKEVQCSTFGPDPESAFIDTLIQCGHSVRLLALTRQHIDHFAGQQRAAYAEVAIGEITACGAGLDSSGTTAVLYAILSAVNRALTVG
jgi:2-isopropylmalate synthase